jgi:hypothetical protein
MRISHQRQTVQSWYARSNIISEIKQIMGLLLDFLDSVLPSPEEASPPIQQKNILLFSEITLLNYIFKIPLLFCYLRRFSS